MNQEIRKNISKIVSVVLVTALTVSVAGFGSRTTRAEEKNGITDVKGNVVVSVEKFTIGQGFVLQPVLVEYSGETSVAQIFDKAMKQAGKEYTATTTAYGMYVSAIKNADNGNVNIPAAISAMERTEQTWTDPVSYLNPPTNETIYENDAYPDLEEYSYYSQAGWMFTSNGSSVDSLSQTVSDGDVIRCQFSIYGYGADIGIGWGSPANVELPEREGLLTVLACANAEKYLSYAPCKEAYQKALETAASYESTKSQIDMAIRQLTMKMAEAVKAAESVVPETSTEKTTTKPPVTEAETTTKTVGRATILKVTNAKGKKAKVSLKKMAGVTGYQLKYSNSKQFKISTVIVSKKQLYTIKNLQKGKTYYIKARAYKVVQGKRCYGTWSKIKKVTIKK